MKLGGLLARLGLSLFVLSLADQLALYLLLEDDALLGRTVAPFDPPLFAPAQRRALDWVRDSLASGAQQEIDNRFDEELGWHNPPEGGVGEFRYDWAGCRRAGEPLPRVKTPGVRRIVALGCSMTHGEEVAAHESWPARLDALREDVEVANLGVAAYGLDQALMRYRRDGRPLAGDEVWLGFLPEAALRVTSLYRPALRHRSLSIGFKPRFVLDENNDLLDVPNPARSLEGVVEMLSSQEEFLARLGHDDFWVERVPAAYAPRGSHPLHYSFAGRVLLTVLESGRRDPADHLRNRDEVVYRLLREIVVTMNEEVRTDGARFRLLVLPSANDLKQTETPEGGYWGGLCQDLEAAGIEVQDLSESLRKAPGKRQELFASGGHYSPAGTRLVAGALSLLLDDRENPGLAANTGETPVSKESPHPR